VRRYMVYVASLYFGWEKMIKGAKDEGRRKEGKVQYTGNFWRGLRKENIKQQAIHRKKVGMVNGGQQS